mgnify:CR=1 FL=1|tara:strand:- start:179 stop:442 length:264 start_codon:yes stop_codon:yes gene_type:complete
MSGLKKFLNRREKGITEKKDSEDEKIEEIEEIDVNLSDDEFWAITNQFLLESKNSDSNQVEILQTILGAYTPLKIEQFAERYKALNS